MSEERIVRAKLSDARKGQTDWARLKAMTEEEIEAAALSDSDNPPIDVDAPDFWEETVVKFPFPDGGRRVGLRIDDDVLYWFQSQGKGFQARMNAVLRAYMEAHIESEKSNPQ
jgi:uncharacterized protein (DUF4415 family)